MTAGVALDIDSQRQAGDMTGHHIKVDGQGGEASSQACRSDADVIDQGQKFVFQGGLFGIRVLTAHFPEQGFFRQQGRLFKGAADADAHYDRRAGIGAGLSYSFDNFLFDAG